MSYTHVMFIDPGTNFGWASLVGIEISSGVVSLPKEPGPRVMEFWKYLDSRMKVVPADESILVWEEAAWGGHSVADRMYGTWEGLMLLYCELHKIPYLTVNGSTLKAYIRTQGFALSVKEAKGMTQAQKKPKPRPEWKLTSSGKLQNNEVDARWGLEYIIKKLQEQ